MYKYRTTTYLGIKVHIVECKSDTLHDFQVSVMADRYDSADPKKLATQFRDTELESQGWQKLAVVNGGLFFSEGAATYSVGIEKAYGVVNELDDPKWDNVLTLYHDNKMLYVAPQLWVKNNISKYRGAVTSAFGLLNNGITDNRGKLENPGQFNTKSGRTIVGKKADGTIMFASFAGVTGQSGLTGLQTTGLAKTLGMTNAVCMDGGGSVSMQYLGSNKISTTREVKNAVAIYIKNK